MIEAACETQCKECHADCHRREIMELVELCRKMVKCEDLGLKIDDLVRIENRIREIVGEK